MRDLRLQVHPEVEETDLVEITSHIAQDNSVAAANVYAAITSMFVELARQPMLGTEIQPLRRTLRGIRMFVVGDYPNYLIYYRPLPEVTGVRIPYVLHAARDAATFAKEYRRK